MMTIYTRILLARSHAAMHRTALLLGRCSCHGTVLAAPTVAQAKWQARQQADFLAWLDGGGLTQETTLAAAAPAQTHGPIENSGVAPLFPAPEAGADEESQFSQVRMHDAVK